MITEEILKAFDRFLHQRQLKVEAMIVGGAAVQLMGLRAVATRDIDSISQIHDAARDAIREFGRSHGLSDDWFNDRARLTLVDHLKFGYGVEGVAAIFSGVALTLVRPSRENLILSKLCAIVDRSSPQDVADLKSLTAGVVSKEEFADLVRYFLKQEGSTGRDIGKSQRALGAISSLLFGV